MTRKLFFAAIALLIFVSPALAKRVDVEIAKTVARTFWIQNLGKQTRATFSDITSQTEFTNFYIFNADGGFVIVSADNIAHPILGYSDEGNFDPQNIPVNTREWLIGYENEISWGISNGVTASEEITAEWEKLSTGQGLTPKRSRSINVLIQTKWDQGGPYNNLCPYDSNEDVYAYTGCVATAMAQVMKYWNYPTNGTGSHSYSHATYGTLSADFENTTYDWDNMLNEYNIHSVTQEQKDAVATLMYHCGVAVNMDYGTDGSGAYLISGMGYNYCAESALKNFFGYKQTLQGRTKSSYSDTDWKDMLRAELEAGRPMLYSGGIHAFICDGYNSNDYFHFNWGWSGHYDGFFMLDALTPYGIGIGGGDGNFTSGQKAIIGIEPPSAGLFVIPNSLALAGIGESKTFMVHASTSSEQQWSATSNQTWLTVSPTTGEGNGTFATVTATATRNYTDSERTATITITQGSETATITVVQPSGMPNAIGCYGTDDIEPISNYEIPVQSDDHTYWYLGSGQMAIICSESFGTGYYTSGHQVTTVRFTTLDGELTYWYQDFTNNSFTIKIYEGRNIEESLYYETSYGTMGTEVYSQDYTQSFFGEQEVTLDTPYTIDENTNFWIAIVANGNSLIRAKYIEYGEPYPLLEESRDPFNGKYLYSDVNVLYPLEDWEYADEDSTTLQAYSVDLALSFCVVDPDLLVVTPGTLRFDFDPDGGELNFTVKANNSVSENWTAVSSAEWLTLSTTSGEGDGAITIVTATAEGNTERDDRMATITVTHGSETKTINVVSEGRHGKFYLDLSVNDTSLGYLPDLSGWHTAYSSSGLGDVYISYFQERLIAAHPYANARFVDWNYYGDLSGIRTDIYRHDYISVNYDEGYDPEQDTLSIEAVFAPVRCGDTLLYDSGQDPFRADDPTSDTATYYRWGVKFDPGTLGGITEIPMVEAYLSGGRTYTGYVSCTYTIQLWQGGNDSPQTQLHTQSYTISEYDSYQRWHGIIFNTPVAIDSTQPLWITISGTLPTYNTTTNRALVPMFTSGYCGNPNSNYIWTSQTGWTHYNAGPGWDDFNPTANEHSYSWLIRAYSAVNYVATGVYGIGDTEIGNDHVNGGEGCTPGSSVTLTAVPDSGHCFKYWVWNTIDNPEDRHTVTDNPVTFTISSRVYYAAYFSSNAEIFVYNTPENVGDSDISCNGQTYDFYANLTVGNTATITANPSGSTFSHWEWHYKCNPSVVYQVTENPYTFTVDGDAEYTAHFEPNAATTHITVRANNNSWGTVSGGGDYQTYETAVLRATPNSGYRFQYWMYAGYSGYQIEDNPFYLTIEPGMSGNYALIGYFTPVSDIDDNTDDDIVIHSLDGCIIVEGAESETVTIYDMTGRIVRDCGLPNGVYMVKVGDRTPRKVVVAR